MHLEHLKQEIHYFLRNHLKDFLIFDHHQQLKYEN